MLGAQETSRESVGRLTVVELKVLVCELRDREDSLRESTRALRRSGRWRDARIVESKRVGLERERKVAERRIRAEAGGEE